MSFQPNVNPGEISTSSHGPLAPAGSTIVETTLFSLKEINANLDVLYMPCRINRMGRENLVAGKTAQITFGCINMQGKLCVLMPYMIGDLKETSVLGKCVCVGCLRSIAEKAEMNQRDVISTIWEETSGSIIVTTLPVPLGHN